MMRVKEKMQTIFISTLGSEPQVVTTMLDELRRRKVDFLSVQVVHTESTSGVFSQAVRALTTEFKQYAAYQNLTVEFHPAQSGGIRFSDVDSPAAARAVLDTLYRLIHSAKLGGAAVHLSIAGGRKSMALMAMAAAQLLFDENDHLWHLFSSQDFLTSKRMHPGVEDHVELLEIPVLFRNVISPVLGDLHDINDGLKAVERLQSLTLERRLADITLFLEKKLTAAERRVVDAMIAESLSLQEAANRLHLSARTVERHLLNAYQKAENTWGLEHVTRADLTNLILIFYTINEKNGGFSARQTP